MNKIPDSALLFGEEHMTTASDNRYTRIQRVQQPVEIQGPSTIVALSFNDQLIFIPPKLLSGSVIVIALTHHPAQSLVEKTSTSSRIVYAYCLVLLDFRLHGLCGSMLKDPRQTQ